MAGLAVKRQIWTAVVSVALLFGFACGDVTLDAQPATDAGMDASADVTREPSECHALTTKTACCAALCNWLPGQDGVPSRCISTAESCFGAIHQKCSESEKCYVREYGCQKGACDYEYTYCTQGIGVCISACPPGSEPYLSDDGQPSCWGGKGVH